MHLASAYPSDIAIRHAMRGQGAAFVVPDLAALKALAAPYPDIVVNKCRSTPGDQGGGSWVFRTGDQSANVTADPEEGLWAAPDSDPTGASGAWQRQFVGPVHIAWTGAAVQAAANLAHGKEFFVPPGNTVTIAVPSQQATLQAALDAVRRWVIPEDAAVQINIADGLYTFAAGLDFSNPNGDRIRVVGNTATPSNVKLRVSTNGITLFYVGAGSGLYCDGLQVEHTNSADRALTTAFLADEGGFINLGANMIVSGFFWNLFARRNGVIRALDGGVFTLGGDANALAYQGGHISVRNCDLTDCDDALSTLGSGAVCEGGSLDITGSTLTGNSRAGLHCISGYVRAGTTDFSSNDSAGIRHDGGEIDLTTGCTAGANGTYGYERGATSGRSTVLGLSTLVAGGAGANGTLLFKPFVEDRYTTQPGDQIVSPNTNESRRYDSKGTGSHLFNTSGGLQFRVNNTALAVEYLYATGAASGGVPLLQAEGSSTDVIAGIAGKGASGVRLYSRGVAAFEAFCSASAVNYLAARGRATGEAAQLEALGSDTNISISFAPKGSGTVTASSVITALSATAVGAGANTQAFIKASSTSNLGVYYGTGDPTLSAAKGSLYTKTDATTTTTRLWVNTDGGTTWANFTASA